jgi:hypothetical protein
MKPPTGPDSSIATGASFAIPEAITPPFYQQASIDKMILGDIPSGR